MVVNAGKRCVPVRVQCIERPAVGRRKTRSEQGETCFDGIRERLQIGTSQAIDEIIERPKTLDAPVENVTQAVELLQKWSFRTIGHGSSFAGRTDEPLHCQPEHFVRNDAGISPLDPRER